MFEIAVVLTMAFLRFVLPIALLVALSSWMEQRNRV